MFTIVHENEVLMSLMSYGYQEHYYSSLEGEVNGGWADFTLRF